MDEIQQNKLIDSVLDDKLFLPWVFNPSEELDNYWDKVMQNEPEKEKVIDDLKTIIKGIKIDDECFSIDDKKELWKRIETSTQSQKVKRFKLSVFLRYAAVFLLVAGTSVYFYFTRYSEETPVDYSQLISEVPDSTVHSDNVLIVLGNQEKIELKEKNVELVHDADGRISVNAEVLESIRPATGKEEEFNKVYVPYGKTTSLILSEGTKIWVNSGSQVIYPNRFSTDRREIYVEGEAYLEVARNEKSPFIVKTDLLEINVLGTSFNVSAYKNDPDQSVVLATGSVSIKELSEKTSTRIKPNQQYLIDKSTKKHQLNKVDVLDHISWKYGFLTFKNERLTNVIKKVERYYNVSVNYYELSTGNTTFSGKLDLKENIEEILRVLAITAPIEYKINENEINIYVKP